jgi:hypothetical protein
MENVHLTPINEPVSTQAKMFQHDKGPDKLKW